MQEYWAQILDQLITSIPNILAALLIFIVSLYFARLLSRLIKRALERRSTSSGVVNLLSQTVRWVIISFGIITALQRFFNVTAFLTGLGILGFTIGFALQNIMQNFAAGVILLIQRPFHVGDIISTTNYTGTILAIDLRTTEMKTLDGRLVMLPNATILANPIENFTRADRRRVDLNVGVAYDADPEKVRSLVLEAVQAVAGFVSVPEPAVVFHTFGSSSIELTAYFWIDTKLTNPPAAKDAALTKVKTAFEKAKVEIPHPAQAVLVQSKK
jgi:small-conductance mechanosensitive channel